MDMDDGAKLWMFKTAQRNFWKVHRWYEFDDLIQDGYMWWYRMVQKYDQVTEIKHMMRLFQIRYIQHVNDIANARTKVRQESLLLDLNSSYDNSSIIDRLIGYDDDFSAMCRVVSDAPPPVRDLLHKMMHEIPPEKLRSTHRFRLNGTRPTMNEKMCKYVDLDPAEINLCFMLRNYLSRKTLRYTMKESKTSRFRLKTNRFRLNGVTN